MKCIQIISLILLAWMCGFYDFLNTCPAMANVFVSSWALGALIVFACHTYFGLIALLNPYWLLIGLRHSWTRGQLVDGCCKSHFILTKALVGTILQKFQGNVWNIWYTVLDPCRAQNIVFSYLLQRLFFIDATKGGGLICEIWGLYI